MAQLISNFCKGAELAKQRVHDMAAQKKKAVQGLLCGALSCNAQLAAVLNPKP